MKHNYTCLFTILYFCYSGDMSKLDTLLQDGLQSELMLQYHLKTLRKTLKQQLDETKMRQTVDLEKRVHQNSLLLAELDKKSSKKEELNKQKYDFCKL